MKALKIGFEYFCSPLWLELEDGFENIEIADFELSDELKNEILFLDDCYQSTYNDDYPPDVLPMEGISYLDFQMRVQKCMERLQSELEGVWEIHFSGHSVGLPSW